ncbi:ABC transporter-like protein [Psychromonas sp. CNPT3]|uniref:ABC transporter ATP-binding protein n=1 Tax=Psychromonas sp. CNPT3 TaxID=314282 RepID=UPI00006E9E40|nr:ABC transporter ATP-binding protein [Psychromonas sp. CNPT3]AGH82363.1 ABC transporter-like protein [Psychromonas sp. CNPT3]
MHEFVIETRAMSKRFGNVLALDNLDIQIKKGEFVAFMGASGSGKTTLLNILSCLDVPSSGQVILDGIDAGSLDEDSQRQFRANKVGLIFQQFHLIPYLNVLENIMLAQHYHSVVDERAARKVLQHVGLSHRETHLPKQLSGGEQQRACIARALINEPPIIFADEPTGNLDEENEKRILAMLKDLNKAGRTIIMVTHNPELGAQSDRIITLQHGKIMSEVKNSA